MVLQVVHSSITTWELVRNANARAPPGPTEANSLQAGAGPSNLV